jgi:hypothetical protein
MEKTWKYIERYTKAYFEGFDKIIAGKQLYDDLEERYGTATLTVEETQQLTDDLKFFEKVRLKEEKTLADKKDLRAVATNDAKIQELDAEIVELEGGLEQIYASIFFLKAKLNASEGE